MSEAREREKCQRCGYLVPSRRRGTGYCTNKCATEQERDDRESAAEEWGNDRAGDRPAD